MSEIQSEPPRGTTMLFPATAEPLSFIQLGVDDTVTVVCKSMEMGQGIYTGLATLVAEELDASHDQMRVVAAPIGSAYGNVVMGGVQGTGGQTSMQAGYMVMRQAGAAMRSMILSAAAARWSVDVSSLDIEQGVVRERDGIRSARFGEFAHDAMARPVPADVIVKDPSRFIYIGKRFARLDAADKISGQARFTQDLKLPGMLTAVIARPSRAGAVVASFDATRALAFAGVRHIVQVPAGIAVVADDFWTAMQGRDLLKIEWDLSQSFRKSSADIYTELRSLVDSDGGVLAAERGDAIAALTGATTQLSGHFQVPYQTHAPMETMNIVVQLRDNALQVWGGMQMVSIDQYQLAQAAGVTPDKVTFHMQMTGGSFGRRATAHSIPGIEALSIVRALGINVPLKLMYDRPDDMAGPHNAYRPAFAHRIDAGLDADGRVVAWRHRLAGQSIATGTLMEGVMVHDGIDFFSVEGGLEQPYDIPNLRMELHSPTYPITPSWLRTSGVFHNAFAIESMMDMLALAAGKDPIEFRRAALPLQSRERGCIDRVADEAGWFAPMAADAGGGRRGRGVAVTFGHRSYGAVIVEVTVATDGGSYSVDRVVSVLDCGLVINPDNVMSQIEGSVAFGLSLARFGQITFTDGEVDQQFFSDYHVTRMHTMPVVVSHIVQSAQPPSGASETIACVIAPALANALAMASGKRCHVVPLVLPDEVIERWSVPAGLNTFAGAKDWTPPANWLPISSRIPAREPVGDGPAHG